MATVASIEPNVLGLRARGVLGDQILLSNLSPTRIVILDPSGRASIHVPSGESHTWHDQRVLATDEPPSGDEPQVVKNWRIPGRAGGRRFEIVGFLGWVPPPQSGDDGTSPFLLGALALALVGLSLVGVFVLGRRA